MAIALWILKARASTSASLCSEKRLYICKYICITFFFNLTLFKLQVNDFWILERYTRVTHIRP